MWTQIRLLPLGAVWSGSTLFACLQKIGLKSLQKYSADDINTTFSDAGFLGALRVKMPNTFAADNSLFFCCFFFHREITYFMWIVCLADNSHEMWSLIYSEKFFPNDQYVSCCTCDWGFNGKLMVRKTLISICNTIIIIEGWAQVWSKSDGWYPPNLISSPWKRYEDYNISFCKQCKFRCHCSYEQWHLNLHCLQKVSCP